MRTIVLGRDSIDDALKAEGITPGTEFVITTRAELLGNMPGGARRTDPATSQRAAQAAAPKMGTHRWAVLAAVGDAPDGLTAREVLDATGIDGVWKRCSELKEDGFLVPRGERFVAKTGNDQEVLHLTLKARGLLGLPTDPVVTGETAPVPDVPATPMSLFASTETASVPRNAIRNED